MGSRRRQFLVSSAIALVVLACCRVARAQECAQDASAGQACMQGTGACATLLCTSSDDLSGLPPNESTTPCQVCEALGCPLERIGQPCDAGMCAEAACTPIDDAGFSLPSHECAICILVPRNGCSAAMVGEACPEGGICTMIEGLVLGPAETIPPDRISYGEWVCAEQPPVITGNDAAPPSEAGLPPSGEAAEAGVGDATTSGLAPSVINKGCGCTAGSRAPGSGGAIPVVAVLALLGWRRFRCGRTS
jgi:MYXO-CTERM domain-containing protein